MREVSSSRQSFIRSRAIRRCYLAPSIGIAPPATPELLQLLNSYPRMSSRDQILDLKRRIVLSVIGQEAVVDLLPIALLANGHLLMEGLPGLALRGRRKPRFPRFNGGVRHKSRWKDARQDSRSGSCFWAHYHPGQLWMVE